MNNESSHSTIVGVVFVVVTILVLIGASYFYSTLSKENTSDNLIYGLQETPANISTTTTQSSSTPASADLSSTSEKFILNKNLKHMVTLSTSLGDITIKLNPDLAPKTVANFEQLAQSGFYDGTLFHRVIPGFMIQGGDPLTKSEPKNWSIHGTGGPGYKFADEISANSKNVKGSIAMANSGPNTNGSQFYINTVDNSPLDGNYTVFGMVVSGMEVAEKIQNVKRDAHDHPLEDVVIKKVTVK
jgi:peptidyl-prolyl cis-trans isomerase B (cyclophilin B)